MACARPTIATPDSPLVTIASPQTPAGGQRPGEHCDRARATSSAPEGEQRSVGERHERKVVHRHLHQADGQSQRRVEDACEPSAPPPEDRPCQQPRGDRAKQAERQPGSPYGRLGEPQQPERARHRPEEEHGLVGKRLPEKPRHDVVTALHHLLCDGCVEALVRIGQRVVQREREDEERNTEDEQGGEESPSGHKGGISVPKPWEHRLWWRHLLQVPGHPRRQRVRPGSLQAGPRHGRFPPITLATARVGFNNTASVLPQYRWLRFTRSMMWSRAASSPMEINRPIPGVRTKSQYVISPGFRPTLPMEASDSGPIS